jgi:hypothetical protein
MKVEFAKACKVTCAVAIDTPGNPILDGVEIVAVVAGDVLDVCRSHAQWLVEAGVARPVDNSTPTTVDLGTTTLG